MRVLVLPLLLQFCFYFAMKGGKNIFQILTQHRLLACADQMICWTLPPPQGVPDKLTPRCFHIYLHVQTHINLTPPPRTTPVWNSLPASVAEAPSLVSFKKRLSILSF